MLSQSSLSFRFGQVIDRDPENENYDADYVLLDYLDGLVTAKRRVDIPALSLRHGCGGPQGYGKVFERT